MDRTHSRNLKRRRPEENLSGYLPRRHQDSKGAALPRAGAAPASPTPGPASPLTSLATPAVNLSADRSASMPASASLSDRDATLWESGSTDDLLALLTVPECDPVPAPVLASQLPALATDDKSGKVVTDHGLRNPLSKQAELDLALLANPELRHPHPSLPEEIRALFFADVPVARRCALYRQRLDLADLFRIHPSPRRGEPVDLRDYDRIHGAVRDILRPLLDWALEGSIVELALQFGWMVEHRQNVISEVTRDLLMEQVHQSPLDVRRRLELLRAIHHPRGPVSLPRLHYFSTAPANILERIEAHADKTTLRREYLSQAGALDAPRGLWMAGAYGQHFHHQADFLTGTSIAPGNATTATLRECIGKWMIRTDDMRMLLANRRWAAPAAEWERNMVMLMLGFCLASDHRHSPDPFLLPGVERMPELDSASFLTRGVGVVAWAQTHLALRPLADLGLLPAPGQTRWADRVRAHMERIERAPEPIDPRRRAQERALRSLALATHILSFDRQPMAPLPALDEPGPGDPHVPEDSALRIALRERVAAGRVAAWRIAFEYDSTMWDRPMPEDAEEADLAERGRAAHASLWACRRYLLLLRELDATRLEGRLRLWLEGPGPIHVNAEEFDANLALLIEVLDRTDAQLAPQTRHALLRRYSTTSATLLNDDLAFTDMVSDPPPAT